MAKDIRLFDGTLISCWSAYETIRLKQEGKAGLGVIAPVRGEAIRFYNYVEDKLRYMEECRDSLQEVVQAVSLGEMSEEIEVRALAVIEKPELLKLPNGLGLYIDRVGVKWFRKYNEVQP